MNGNVSARAPVQLQFFHNTTGLKGKELRQANLKATSQAFRILQFFRQHPGEHFTPYDVRRALGLDPLAICEVKRSMSDLSNARKFNPPFLVKTEVKKPGDRGADNHTWRLL